GQAQKAAGQTKGRIEEVNTDGHDDDGNDNRGDEQGHDQALGRKIGPVEPHGGQGATGTRQYRGGPRHDHGSAKGKAPGSGGEKFLVPLKGKTGQREGQKGARGEGKGHDDQHGQ